MPEDLVELYSITANPDSAALARLGEGESVRYLRSILIPDRIVEAVGLQASAVVDNEGGKS